MELTLWSPATDGEETSAQEEFLSRAIGTEATDITIDLWADDPEVTLSELLAACLTDGNRRPFDKRGIATWTLKRRMQGLLAIAVATAGDLWRARQRCPDAHCGELLELELSLEAFRGDWRGETLRVSLSTGESLELRRPTTADLRQWADSGRATPRSIAESLLIGDTPPALAEIWLEESEAALEEDDPTSNLQLAMTCPCCGNDSVIEFPLQDFLLSDLKRRGQWLLDEVHCLASAYHWSEADILALPHGRRQCYLARIREELAA